METIWVLENVKNDTSFYNEIQILLLITSVSLWKKYHPQHKTVFYCDTISYEYLKKYNIFHLWDSIRNLSYPEKINREVFWSSSKTKIISETKIPLLIIDHDFLIFKNIDEYLTDDILYSYDEIASNWYPKKTCSFNRKLKTPVEYIVDRASNVSLFYLPNPEFSRKYGKQTLQNHVEFTKMNDVGVTTNHMILSEQFMLKQWLVKDNISHKTLSSNLWDCVDVRFIRNTDNKIGIWNYIETPISYKHYGMEERITRECGSESHQYKSEIDYLYRCLNSTHMVDVPQLKEKFKTYN